MARKGIWLASPAALALMAAQPALADDGDRTISEVVVTAAPYAVSLESATTSINIVTRKDLDAAPAAGLGDVLSGLPGLRSTFHGPGASRPIIRGLSGPRVLILQNGVGLVDASSLSPDHAVASDPGEAARIEVLRGPSTLAYGGSAIGGVVNILDERVPATPAKDGLEGRLSAAVGSADKSRSFSVGLKAGRGPWVAALDAVRRSSDDYRVPVAPVSRRLAAIAGETALPDRTVHNTDVALEAYGAGASFVGEHGHLGAAVKRTETRYGLPYPQVEGAGTAAEGQVYIALTQTRWDLRGERSLDWGLFDRVRGSLGYADYKHSEISVMDGLAGATFLSDGAEGRVELVHREHDGHQGAIGAQGLRRRLQAIGDEAFIPPVEIEEAGVFTLQRLDLGRWGIEGGLRLDRRTLSAALAGRPSSAVAASAGIDWTQAHARRDFTNLSASAAVFWRPQEAWFLGLSLARNRRAPTEFELFADGPHAGTGGYEVGDPTLSSEAASSVEGTVRWTGEAARLEVHLYATRYRGFIDAAYTGARANEDGGFAPDGGSPVLRFVQADARFHGGEVEGSYAIWRDGERSLVLEGAADLVRGTTDAGPAARIPPPSVTGRVVWAGPRLKAQLEVRRVAEQARAAPLELPTDGYTLVNAQVTVTPLVGRYLRLFLDARNLTNVEAREHASFLKEIAPLPGRSVRLGLGYSF